MFTEQGAQTLYKVGRVVVVACCLAAVSVAEALGQHNQAHAYLSLPPLSIKCICVEYTSCAISRSNNRSILLMPGCSHTFALALLRCTRCCQANRRLCIGLVFCPP